MDYRALCKCIKLITQRVNRNVAIVIQRLSDKNARNTLEYCMARVWNGLCAVAGHNDTVRRTICTPRIRLYETALVRDISVLYVESVGEF